MKRFRNVIMSAAIAVTLFWGSQETACARGRVYVRVAPPAPRVIVTARPACRYKNGVWEAGYWQWRHGKHVWVDGRWIKAKPGHVWVDGHWVNTAHGWEWIPGHWRK